ncbi:hypothetical protein ABKN59_011623 [Abortiporus biennis]
MFQITSALSQTVSDFMTTATPFTFISFTEASSSNSLSRLIRENPHFGDQFSEAMSLVIDILIVHDELMSIEFRQRHPTSTIIKPIPCRFNVLPSFEIVESADKLRCKVPGYVRQPDDIPTVGTKRNDSSSPMLPKDSDRFIVHYLQFLLEGERKTHRIEGLAVSAGSNLWGLFVTECVRIWLPELSVHSSRLSNFKNKGFEKRVEKGAILASYVHIYPHRHPRINRNQTCHFSLTND